MSNKKGMEIGINMIVILIMAILVFGLSIKFAFDIIGKTTKMKAELDANSQEQIRNQILDQNAQVVVYPGVMSITRANSQNFGIGILNSKDSEINYVVSVKCVGYQPKNQGITAVDCSNSINLLYIGGQAYPIQAKKTEVIPVLVTVDKAAASGKYVIDAKVCEIPGAGSMDSATCADANTKPYGSLQKVYITVP